MVGQVLARPLFGTTRGPGWSGFDLWHNLRAILYQFVEGLAHKTRLMQANSFLAENK